MNNDDTPVRRGDLRAALAWIAASRTRRVLVALLLVCGGAASSLGYLRWQQPVARWSFALLFWILAVVVMWRTSGSRADLPRDSSESTRGGP